MENKVNNLYEAYLVGYMVNTFPSEASTEAMCTMVDGSNDKVEATEAVLLGGYDARMNKPPTTESIFRHEWEQRHPQV